MLICTFVRLASRHSPDSPPAETGPCLENLFLSAPPPCFRKTSIWSLSTPAVVMPHHRAARFVSDEDEDDDEGTVIYSRTSSTTSLRTRFVVTKVCEPKSITTTPGLLGAGETETESEDHHPRQLPTARIVQSSGPIIPPTTLQQRLTPFLFSFSRWLSIVPASIGTLYNIFCAVFPPQQPAGHRVDFVVSVLWAILTGYQCLALTTGLLRRWRVYYSPLPTLIRLLALQAICWPATQITLSVLDAKRRPAICWAVIATTTCCSRAVQLWVTSNIIGGKEDSDQLSLRRWGGRRWDWNAVAWKCAFPAGVLYLIWAWTLALRQEFDNC